MRKAIYKITNLINGKIYIGQSKNPALRWKQHSEKPSHTSLIYEAIQKYGQSNFTFEIMEWTEDYKSREKYWINQFQSKVPHGYNLIEGGGDPPLLKGENHPEATISQEMADRIIEQLLDWRVPRKTIVHNNKVTHDIVRHINEGRTWRKNKLQYPLRPQERELDKIRVKYIQLMCCNSNVPLNQIGNLVGWGRSSAKMINQGHNHYDKSLKYPLRNNKEHNQKILNQETCNDYLPWESKTTIDT